MAKKPFRLTDKQVRLFTNDMQEFGYDVSQEQVRVIADAVCDGTFKKVDPVAMILKKQLAEAGIEVPEIKAGDE
jgi:hypothetical protein